jgi:hypothetical protein
MPRRLLLAALLLLSCGGVVADDVPDAAAIGSTLPTSRSATIAELTLLNEALHNAASHYPRWAYTERRILRNRKGEVKSDILVRYDPSRPYAEQWTPISIDGREPTDHERAKYRRRGEKSARSYDELGGMPNPDNRRRRTLGELIEVMNSSVASESATHVVFEIPLLKAGNERFPPEKFLVLARIQRAERRLENVSVQLRDSFRSKVVVKVKSGEGALDFSVVDPAYPPALTRIEGSGEASVLFINVGGSMTLQRTELKHVTLFDERFEVQIGTLKAIDF